MSFRNRGKFKGDLLKQTRGEAEQRKRELSARIFGRTPTDVQSEPPAVPALEEPGLPRDPVRSQPILVQRVQNSRIALYRDDDERESYPGCALIGLADLYLHAAEHHSHHIALVWPAPLKTLTLVHALSTLARWFDGDKKGIRGLLFPVKSNAFTPLNHIHFDRQALLRIASELIERPREANSRVRRSVPQKDAFLFSLNESGPREGRINPTVGELLPHFLAASGFTEWTDCAERLLAVIRAKLVRRKIAGSLKELHCAFIGDPRTAPDALFALDARMSESELRRAARKLAKLGPPEVVLISVTKLERQQTPNWKSRVARFCMMMEEIFRSTSPGFLIVTDEAHVAYKLKNELWDCNSAREPERRWDRQQGFDIRGFPSMAMSDGLLPPGSRETLHPIPREFDVHIVDADVAKIANRLVRISSEIPGGRAAAKPLMDAAAYLSRMAALPCGIRHVSEYLAGPDVTQRTRLAFDWPAHIGSINDFDRASNIGRERPDLMKCIDRSSRLVENYNDATPFAHKLAELVANATISKRRHVVVVFTGALYRRLAERFLIDYNQYPLGSTFKGIQDRVHLILAANLEGHLNGLEDSALVFAGLDEDCLRVILTDDRVPAHSAILLTQRTAQFLRASLKPIAENFSEFKAFKPRIESILRQLKDLPDDSSVLSTGDYVLPTFRIELTSDASADGDHIDPDSWLIRLDNGTNQYRREISEVYVYDPTAQDSSDRGFRACQVKSLEIGDKLFVMSAELREMVEQALRDAGVAIQTDKTFEGALRNYHEQVQRRLGQRFPYGTLPEKVRALRSEILATDPKIETDLPQEQAMRNWIDLGESPSTPFEKLRPQAPLREPAFKAFAQVLGFSPLEAAYQWQRVIMAVRNSRRLDGRHVSDIYAYMLLQPESAMANSNIKRQTLALLFDKARESVATVEQVGPVEAECS